MQESVARPPVALQPATIFRSALAAAARKERSNSSRVRRPDRVRAIAALTEDDLDRLAAESESLLRVAGDKSTVALHLTTALRALSPDVLAEEDSNA